MTKRKELRENLGERLGARIAESRRQYLQQAFLSDEFLNFMEENRLGWDTMMAYYKCAIMEVETKFRVLDQQFSLENDRNPIEGIKSRTKSMDSLLRKIRKKNIPLTMEAISENISDIAGVRVICSFVDDIYMLADCFLEQDDIRLVERKDYIANPKESGYRSLHLIIEVPIFLKNEKRIMKVEVQLRTLAMDFWASLEHQIRYKKNLSPEQDAILAAELQACAEESARLDLRMERVKDSIIYEEHRDGRKPSRLPGFFPEPPVPLLLEGDKKKE